MKRCIKIFFLLAVICQTRLTALQQSDVENASPDTFRVLYTDKIFFGIDLRDAKVAMEIWTEELGRQMDIITVPTTQIANDVSTIAQLINSKKIDMVGIDTPDFIRLREIADIEPSLVGVKGGTSEENFLFLVHNESDITELSQLRNLDVNIHTGPITNIIIDLWLKSLIRSSFGTLPSKFFSETKNVNTPSQALLPVFFKQATACVLGKKSFNVLTDLNPQLKNNLRIIKVSPAFLLTVFCFRKGMNEHLKQTVIDAALNMVNYPKGQQILTLFKIDNVTQFEEAQLKNVIDLMAQPKQ